MSKKTKILILTSVAIALCSIAIGVVSHYVNMTNNIIYTAENTNPSPLPGRLTADDIFVSFDFSPLLSQSNFSHRDILLYDGISFPNYLNTRRDSANILQPYQTMLYITHKNISGESRYVVYNFSYGFEFTHDVPPDGLENIRKIYFEHLKKLIESVSVEDLEMSVDFAFMDVFYGLRTFINEQMYTNGVNMYLSVTTVAPLFNLLDLPNNQMPFSSIDFIAFTIENGISQPASTVTIIDDFNAVIDDTGFKINVGQPF